MNSIFSFCIILSIILLSCSGKQEVIETTYPDGKPKVVGIYKDSIKIHEITYYPEGQKEMEGDYNIKLQRHGQWTYWYKNGKVWSEGEFKDGLKNGKSIVYYENGQKRYEGMYRNDSTAGNWKFWDEQGNLVKEVNY